MVIIVPLSVSSLSPTTKSSAYTQPLSTTQNGWPPVVVIISSPIYRLYVLSVMFLYSSSTSLYAISPVSGSFARTLSPISISSIGFNPSFVNISVSAGKQLHGIASPEYLYFLF